MKFEPARTVRAFEAVVAQLRAGITEGRLRPGDRLPATQTLARDFGVSRNAVLEALRVLERSGLVTIRRGSRGGAFVRALNGDELTDHLFLMMEIDVPVNDMVEVRRLVEGSTAAWAAERATSAEIDGIGQIVQQWEGFLAEGEEDDRWLAALGVDVRFHLAIADAAHNAAAAAFVRGLVGSLQRMMAAFPRDAAMAASAPLPWVFEPIAARKPDLARRRMQRHIGDFAELAAKQGRLAARRQR
jgi:GntR family transcriptional regulator, transcriptional repressor for pyruvate dehydrogenase complex